MANSKRPEPLSVCTSSGFSRLYDETSLHTTRLKILSMFEQEEISRYVSLCWNPDF